MKEEIELLNLLLSNPELKILQDRINYETRNMDTEQKLVYLQEEMLDNLTDMLNKLDNLSSLDVS